MKRIFYLFACLFFIWGATTNVSAQDVNSLKTTVETVLPGLTATVSGNTLTVAGTASGDLSTGGTLTIPAGVTLEWKADFTNTGDIQPLTIKGAGLFRMLEGSISNTGDVYAALDVSSSGAEGNVLIEGGTLANPNSTDLYACALHLMKGGRAAVKGGTLTGAAGKYKAVVIFGAYLVVKDGTITDAADIRLEDGYPPDMSGAVFTESGGILTVMKQNAGFNHSAVFNGDNIEISNDALPVATVCYGAATPPPNPFAGGGTAADPYQVSTPAELTKLANFVNSGTGSYSTLHYILTENLALTGSHTPIGTSANPFAGHFDGNGKTISGLSIIGDGLSNQGLFGYVTGGSLTGLGIVDGHIAITNNSSCTGALAGYIENAVVSNCYATGTVEGYAGVGGLAGEVNGTAVLQNCFSHCTVVGIEYVGGLAGSTSGIIRDCYSTGNATGEWAVGGISGEIYSDNGSPGLITNCYATGTVTATDNQSGGIVGGSAQGTVTNCIALGQTVSSAGSWVGRICLEYSPGMGVTLAGNAANKYMETLARGSHKALLTGDNKTDGEDRTAGELGKAAAWTAFAAANGWSYAAGQLPVLSGIASITQSATIPAYIADPASAFAGSGSAIDPYQIQTMADLISLAGLVNLGDIDYNDKHYILGDNITYTGSDWTPIGNDFGNPFSGVFNGNGHTISGLKITSGTENIGLFGILSGATVSNLGVIDCSITSAAGYQVGAIAGQVTGGIIENCFSTGSVQGDENVGGIAGACYFGGRLTNCYSLADVTATTQAAGGITGFTGGENNLIENCFSAGTVTAGDAAGGIAGRLGGKDTLRNGTAINESIVTTSAPAASIGRLVGNPAADALFEGSNHAWDGMLLDGATVADGEDKDGAGQTAALLRTAAGWPAAFAGIYTMTDGKLPTLSALAGQSDELPVYLQEQIVQPTTYTVYIPDVEGASFPPNGSGYHTVTAGSDYSFTISLQADYSESFPTVTTDRAADGTIAPDASGRYYLRDIQSDIQVFIHGISKNVIVEPVEPVGTEEGISELILRTTGSRLFIQTAKPVTIRLFTITGQAKYHAQSVRQIDIPLPKGIYIVVIDGKAKKIVINET